MKRNEVKLEDKWKLEDIYATDAAFNESLSHTQTILPSFKEYENRLISSADTLLAFLQAQDAFEEELGKLYVYSHMRLHEDGNNSFYQDLSQKTESLSIQAGSILAFAGPELSKLTHAQLEQFFSENPALRHYERYLNEVLRQKEHILDHATETLLAQVADIANIPDNTFSMLNNVDIKFPVVQNENGQSIQLTHATYIPLMESFKRDVRENAFKALYGTYHQFKNTTASLFSGNIKQNSFFAKVRHYNSTLHMALAENNIPLEVYHNLIDVVNQNLSILHHYMTLRKETLGLDELHMYDLFVPMVKDYKKEIPFEEAKETILKALACMGEDYIQVATSAFNEGWIDKYENEGKRSGAYSWGTYGAPHPYILLNYTSNIDSMFTLAHELGHAMHSYYSHKEQPHVYGDYCIFVAEVASTVNEALLMQYLLKESQDVNEKRYLLNYFMDQFKSTLYRQTMFAEFEYKVHSAYDQGETLTSDYLSNTYYELVKKYHGASVCVDQEIALEWSRIPHFYTPFYVYQYATGYSAAIALSTRILSGQANAVSDYIRFLSGGCSKDPIDLLKIAGVDMSQPKPVQDALKQFDTLIHDFRALC